MPNHVVTHLYIEGTPEQVEQVKAFVRCDTDKDRLMDFNKIVPCPETFLKYDTTNHPDGKWLNIGYPAEPFDEDSPIVTEELIEEYKKATREQMELYGVVGWYDWNRKNWGTKWNAYDSEDLGNGIKFETAWSFPEPAMIALSKHFPDIDFHFVYADEDASYNTGEGYLRNGEFTQQYYPDNGSKDAWELYLMTHDWASDELELQEDGTYRWKED